MFEGTISTARMTLERCTSETADVRELFAVFDASRDGATEEFEYLPWGPHETPYETHEWLEARERKWRDGESATYAMRANETMDVEAGTLVGITSFETMWERRTGEQIIYLRRPFWGQGLFAESAYEFLDLAFESYGIQLMIADAVEGNERARDLFERGVETFGGQYDGVIRNRLPTDDGVKDVHRYTVTREQYRETMGRTGDDEDERDREAVPATAD